MKSKPRIDVRVAAGRKLRAAWLRRVVSTVLQAEAGGKGGTLSVVIVDDAEIRRLNAEYLGRDRPTDVIAFPLEDDSDDVWGEAYISADRAREQAADYGVTFEEEMARLVIHGVLHLLGYEDGDDASRDRMRMLEDAYLEKVR